MKAIKINLLNFEQMRKKYFNKPLALAYIYQTFIRKQ